MGSGNDSDQGSSGGGGVEDQRDESGCNYWTNERHLSFLSSMEETFVRNMMESHTHRMLINAAADGGAAHHHHRRRRHHHHHLVHRLESPRLDRYVPDISESTLDLQTAKNSSRSVRISDQVGRSGRRHRERPPTSHPYKISLDQVVPHAGDNAGDKDEKERGRPQLQEMII